MTIPARPEVEKERNRLSRRVDWRFLLPDPEPVTAICFTEGELAEGLSLVAARVTRKWTAPADGRFELAVAEDPDHPTLRAAFDALVPGGAIYVEWRRPGGMAPPSAERALRAAGFESIRLFTPHPAPSESNPESWIPLDAAGPVRFAFHTRAPAKNRLRGLGRRIQCRVWLASRALRRASPLCAMGLRPGTTAGARGVSSLPGGFRSNTAPAARESSGRYPDARESAPVTLAAKPVDRSNAAVSFEADIGRRKDPGCPWDPQILAGWRGWGFGDPPDRVSSLLLTGGRNRLNKVVALVFGGAQRAPRVAVKMPRITEAAVPLAREAEVLETLANRAPRVSGVPKVLFRGGTETIPFTGQTVILGRRMSTLLDSGTFRAAALQATEWQILLGESTRLDSSADLKGRIIEPVVQEFEKNFGQVVDSGMLREAAARVSGLASLPSVSEQRDFSPWNLLRASDGTLAVLDWESSEMQGVPGADLAYLLTYMGIYLEEAHAPGRDEEAYRHILAPHTPTGSVARECWDTYTERLGLSADILPAIRLFTWMLHSRSIHERLTRDFGEPPPDGALREALFLRLWRAEMQFGE